MRGNVNTNSFHQRIRSSISSESLQTALDANAERRFKGRISALASLPDWDQRRQRAHAIRGNVIRHLDEYLNIFTKNLTDNGFVVHRASDASDAIKIIMEIAGTISRPQLLFAKSKSMISEEIELNKALEAQGHRVVETDLGEYIIQLRGEKPAHIITPAVHLHRNDVGRLFQEKLGIPYTEDIPTLTNTARKVLREVFLTADVGISGVNFGVAETGTLCTVTNEGNGRMVTTIPPMHIALMGMERLVPSLSDLALMLSLLARSATGQKLTVYTQLINSPKRADEIDGAHERHLIILDNGRSSLQKSPMYEALYCIRCGACLNACPVFRELGGHAYVGSDGSIAPYPGPIGSIISPGLMGSEQFGHLAQASSLCGACKDACPVDIDLPRLLTRVRAGEINTRVDKQGIGLSFQSKVGLRMYGFIASSAGLFSLAQKTAGIIANILFPSSKWIWLPGITGWGSSNDLPRPVIKPFRSRFDQKKQDNLPYKQESLDHHVEELNGPLEEIIFPDEDLVERFIRELEAVGGRGYRTRADQVSRTIIGFLKEREINTALMWDSILGLDEILLNQAGIKLVRKIDPSVKAGITGAVVAIAETGSVVVSSGKGQFLSASLIPEIHLALITRAQIVSTLEEALQFNEVRRASATVLITGPSRTADIEMSLTIGVHGPAEMVVYIIE
jgi:L-lactate dehydrogenase complex protein LldF